MAAENQPEDGPRPALPADVEDLLFAVDLKRLVRASRDGDDNAVREIREILEVREIRERRTAD
ncbi:hypothetical protein LG943_17090 [Streptomonospora sp. S1-112]|uniref:Uncharacterized protein n=1 Tax=Streptomonospora mangrovi TaxID=2883123 RepID=A0A9X3NX95_9ACTN|nr:hypothetical protein [Streptomonospora mangrovi]MDA0566016.1 hypothetical protein [Streptomonospora mangrovi]